MNWIEAISSLNAQAQGYVLVTVLETKGSSPRDTGTKMVVSGDKSFDTIGGGALEYQSIEIARELLGVTPSARGQKQQHTETFNLGKDLKQCCGGVVKVFFEVFHASNFNIVLFGAGHIAKSLIKILEEVDCHVSWFDSRPELFPEKCASHIKKNIMTQPEIAVESSKPNSYFLVMTHDHALDQQLCETILSRGDSHYCGLIGSATKGLKFRQRLMKKGYNKEELEKLTCPSGLSNIRSKVPMEIAVSILSEVLGIRDSKLQQSNTSCSLIKIR